VLPRHTHTLLSQTPLSTHQPTPTNTTHQPCPNPQPLDADIEAILTKGERETADLNDKMNKFTESAKQFTMDGGLSMYDFKDEVRSCI
jgi:hypothetical protein